MNNTYLIFAVFSVLVSVLFFGIWSNIDAYAQQPSSPPSASSTTTISSDVKAKMCDPSSPNLKVVNTTEARICGIAKTVKPPTLAATPPTTSPVSSSKQQQQPTKITKTTPASVANIDAPKQNQIASTNDNNAVSRSSATATGATITPVGNLSNKSLSSQSIIAPQINAISKQQTQQPQLLTTISNGTELQNYTFSSISPVVPPGELMYLGYHGGFTGKSSSNTKSDSSSNSHDNNRDSSSKHTDNSKADSSKHSSDGDTRDSSTVKKKTNDNSKSDSSHSNDSSSSKDKTSHDSKSSNDKSDGGKSSSSSSSSDLGSAIRKKVDSIIKKSISGF